MKPRKSFAGQRKRSGLGSQNAAGIERSRMPEWNRPGWQLRGIPLKK
jgi:hypothetical protein